MNSELKNWMLAQSLCDSLTLRSVGDRYVIAEYFGEHYIFVISRDGESQYIMRSQTYEHLVDNLLQLIEEKIATA